MEIMSTACQPRQFRLYDNDKEQDIRVDVAFSRFRW